MAGPPRLAGPAELSGSRAAEEESMLIGGTPKHQSTFRKTTPLMAEIDRRGLPWILPYDGTLDPERQCKGRPKRLDRQPNHRCKSLCDQVIFELQEEAPDEQAFHTAYACHRGRGGGGSGRDWRGSPIRQPFGSDTARSFGPLGGRRNADLFRAASPDVGLIACARIPPQRDLEDRPGERPAA